MLLYDIFLSLYEHPLNSSLQGLLISAAEFELERQKAVARYRCLNNPEKVVFYRYLLEYFQRNMQGQHTMHVLPLMLNALADDDAPIDSSRACDMLTTLYYLNTKTQENALNFAAMGKAFIDRPRAFGLSP